MQAFDIYFLGEILPGVDPAEVRRGVAKLFNVGEDAVERLFTGKALRVKQNIDVDTAGRYREKFREAGALLQIVPAGGPPPVGSPRVDAAVDAPAAGSDAAGQAAATPPAGAANTNDGITLAAPGATIDDTPAPAPADIDTSGLTALPANTGSLEDCQVEKDPYPIPDISHLKIVDN